MSSVGFVGGSLVFDHLDLWGRPRRVRRFVKYSDNVVCVLAPSVWISYKSASREAPSTCYRRGWDHIVRRERKRECVVSRDMQRALYIR